MTTPLTVAPVRHADGAAGLAVAGEIDLSNSHLLASALDSISGPVRLDLTGVTYLDSAGLSVLFTHAERLEVSAAPLIAPVLRMSGLTDLLSRPT
ncbi:STAS domain-containing protein [Streptomyces sp. NPDC059611]|uniref:STAS domain-containing protein n=1 Tax=Streptomyces sp. NPDC059611 TaxID=3346884 RepID=UPI0036740DAB